VNRCRPCRWGGAGPNFRSQSALGSDRVDPAIAGVFSATFGERLDRENAPSRTFCSFFPWLFLAPTPLVARREAGGIKFPAASRGIGPLRPCGKPWVTTTASRPRPKMPRPAPIVAPGSKPAVGPRRQARGGTPFPFDQRLALVFRPRGIAQPLFGDHLRRGLLHLPGPPHTPPCPHGGSAGVIAPSSRSGCHQCPKADRPTLADDPRRPRCSPCSTPPRCGGDVGVRATTTKPRKRKGAGDLALRKPAPTAATDNPPHVRNRFFPAPAIPPKTLNPHSATTFPSERRPCVHPAPSTDRPPSEGDVAPSPAAASSFFASPDAPANSPPTSAHRAKPSQSERCHIPFSLALA